MNKLFLIPGTRMLKWYHMYIEREPKDTVYSVTISCYYGITPVWVYIVCPEQK
jgi:hypothetical protein